MRALLASVCVACVSVATLIAAPATASSRNGGDPTPGAAAATTRIDRSHGPVPGDDPLNSVRVMAQAQPTECFRGIGVKPGPIANGNCTAGGVPRTMQDYVWGFATAEDQKSLWFGTWSSGLCDNFTAYNNFLTVAGLNFPDTLQSKEVTCEWSHSWNAQQNPDLGITGDQRQPYIYQYDIHSNRLIDRSPYSDPLFATTGGFRAAGAANGVMFVAGLQTSPDLASGQGGQVNLFAFRESDGAYLGSHTYPQYSNVKVVKKIDGQLYMGVGLGTPEGPGSTSHATNGHLLKWVGNVNDPFQWQIVGRFGSQPTYLTEFEGRMIVSAWPAGPTDLTQADLGQEAAALFTSPRLSTRPNGILPADKNNWKRDWGFDDFYPDPTTAAAGAGGTGMEQVGNWLYFGKSNFPGSSTFFHMGRLPDIAPKTFPAFMRWFNRLEVGGELFRVRHLGQPNQQVQVLYGKYRYWTLDDNGQWHHERNLLHQRPLYGKPGFGQKFNYYIGWGSATFRGKAYFGGMDLTRVMREISTNPNTDFISSIFGYRVSPLELRYLNRLLPSDESQDGFPIWTVSSPNQPAKPLTNSGFNNAEQWGARDFFPIGNKEMFIGTQGGSNYPTKAASDPPRRAGWQLLKYQPR